MMLATSDRCAYFREKRHKGHRYVMWRQRCKRKPAADSPYCWQHRSDR